MGVPQCWSLQSHLDNSRSMPLVLQSANNISVLSVRRIIKWHKHSTNILYIYFVYIKSTFKNRTSYSFVVLNTYLTRYNANLLFEKGILSFQIFMIVNYLFLIYQSQHNIRFTIINICNVTYNCFIYMIKKHMFTVTTKWTKVFFPITWATLKGKVKFPL